jgi:hypothetical protein
MGEGDEKLPVRAERWRSGTNRLYRWRCQEGKFDTLGPRRGPADQSIDLACALRKVGMMIIERREGRSE